MHLGAGERTQDKIRRVQLEGSRYADRPPIGDARHHRARAARAADALLPRLVPPGPDGGDRRRRRRSRRRRRDDQGALFRRWRRLRPSGRGRRSTCRTIPARATPSSPTRRRPRPPSRSATCGPARNQGSVGGYRELMLDQLFAGMLGARLDELSQSANPPFLRAAADRGAVPDAADQGRSGAPGAGLERRRRARSRRAGDRAAAGRALRLHRDRARAREAGDDARLRAGRDREPRSRVGEPRRRVHAQFPRRAKRCRRSGRSSPSTAGSSRHHARRGQRAHRRMVPRPEPARRRRRRRKRRASSCPIRRSSRRSSRPPSTKRLEAVRRMTGAGQALMDGAAAARHDRQDDGAARRPASPSGRCRTARPSCSSRRR